MLQPSTEAQAKKRAFTNYPKHPISVAFAEKEKEVAVSPFLTLTSDEKAIIRTHYARLGREEAARRLNVAPIAMLGAMADMGAKAATILMIRTYLKELTSDAVPTE